MSDEMARRKQVAIDKEKIDFLKGLVSAAQRILDDYNDDLTSWNGVRDELEDLRSELDPNDNGWYIRRYTRISRNILHHGGA